MSELKALNVFIPIQRSFEKEGRHFVYGYSMLWHQPDMHNTVISKSVVEKSLSRLMAYPTLRYMHTKPVGKILFDEEIKGVSTHIDSKGFHILAEIFPAHNEEWETIRSGNFGFSYGLGFPETQMVQHNGKFYETFIDGIVYEISIVDSPSCLACEVNTVERYFIPTIKEMQPEGFLAMAEKAFESHSVSRSADFKEILEKIIEKKKYPLTPPMFLKYRDIEPKTPTNQEIQQALKERGEKKNE